MTKREMFEMVKETVKGLANEEIIAEFCDKEIEQLDKKNASNEARKEKRKAEHQELENQVLEIMKETKTATCKEVADEMGFAFQKIAPRMNAMVEKGILTKNVEKKITFFSIAE